LRGLRHPRQQIDAAGGDERVGTDNAGAFDVLDKIGRRLVEVCGELSDSLA
jgi:hypothetical protein